MRDVPGKSCAVTDLRSGTAVETDAKPDDFDVRAIPRI